MSRLLTRRRGGPAILPLVALLFFAVVSPTTYGEGLAVAKKTLSKSAKVRRDLHGNLDGKGDGFIRGWTWQGSVFTFIIDPSRYAPNKFLAAALATRSIFEMDGVPLPRTLIVRTISGEELNRGPFANIPSIVQ